MSAGSAVLRLDAATRRYPSGPASGDGEGFALEPATLEIRPSSWTAVTGRSGAGKTTLLQLLARLDRPDSGRIWMLGRDVTDEPEAALADLRRTALGMLPQRFHLIEHLPAWQNVTCRLVPAGVPRGERRQRARSLLEELGLPRSLDRLPRTLSGGERQRLALARAVIGRPRVLIADEPTSNVDAETGAAIRAFLTEMLDRGTSIVVSTHDPLLIEPADRRIELADGRIAP